MTGCMTVSCMSDCGTLHLLLGCENDLTSVLRVSENNKRIKGKILPSSMGRYYSSYVTEQKFEEH